MASVWNPSGGAVELKDERCGRTLQRLCPCAPKCAVCGHGPHVGLHGPRHGESAGGRPYDHEYVPTERA
jgi:hypothetical protein